MMILSILFIVFFIIIVNIKEYNLELDKKIKECNLLSECDKYGCLADLSIRYDQQTNLLLRQQNCIMEKGITLEGGY